MNTAVKKIPPAFLFFALVQILFAQNAIAPASRVDLFNGANFDGFTFCMKNDACPAATWSVTNGLIHCTGTPAGYLAPRKVSATASSPSSGAL